MPGKILPANLEENLTEYAKKLSKYLMALGYLFRFTATGISTFVCKQCASAQVLDNQKACWRRLAEEFHKETHRPIFKNA